MACISSSPTLARSMSDHTVDVSGVMATEPSATSKSSFASGWPMLSTLPVPSPREWLSQQGANVRPWLLFLQTSNFSAPAPARLGGRVMRNIEFFQSNYVFVFLALVVYCLITSPLLLAALVGTFFFGYRLSKRHAAGVRVRVLGRALPISQQYALLTAGSLVMLYLIGAHSVLFWLIGASFTLIVLHAAFYNIDATLEATTSTTSDEYRVGLLQDV